MDITPIPKGIAEDEVVVVHDKSMVTVVYKYYIIPYPIGLIYSYHARTQFHVHVKVNNL